MIQDPYFWLALLIGPVIYRRLTAHLRPWFLAILSFGYLVSLEPVTVLVTLGAALVIGWLASGRLNKRRVIAVSGVLLAILYTFKFAAMWTAPEPGGSSGTVADRVVVPLGLSYLTFRVIHYVIECNRKGLREHRLIDFIAYVLAFPVFIAGPITRFDDFKNEPSQRGDWSAGVTRIISGLIKRMVLITIIAELQLAVAPDESVEALLRLSTVRLWALLALNFLHLYLDFSAYSDIAIGGCRLFGIRIPENFSWPIIAPTIPEFWRRWHISLTEWCKRYVYMPLLIWSRNPYVATFGTFVVIGLWHAPTLSFLAWGLYHSVGMSVHARLSRVFREQKIDTGAWGVWVGRVITFAFVSGAGLIHKVAGGGSMGDGALLYLKLLGLNFA